MTSIDFHWLLTNGSFPVQVILTTNFITVEIKDFQCDFEIYSNNMRNSFYSIESNLVNTEYSKESSTLKLYFHLKEILIQGKHQLHDLSGIIEKKINNFIYHSNLISSKIEKVIQELSDQYQISLYSLTHENSIVRLKTRSHGDVFIKTFPKNPCGIGMSSPLLTTSLFENYFEMGKPLNLKEVYENLALSAEFQMILNEALKEYSSQALKPYVSGSYTMGTLVCTPNAYNEIHLCYMKEMIVKIRVTTFPYTIEVLDLAYFYSSLKKIRKLDGCLHHSMTKALKDPDLSGFKNTVITNSQGDTYQILELHKPEHVKNAIVFLINYIHLIYLFEVCKTTIEDLLKILGKPSNKNVSGYKMLDLRLELSNYDEYRYNLILKMKNNNTNLEIDLDIEIVHKRDNELEKLSNWKKILILYFNNVIKPYYRGTLDLMVGFVKLFVVSLGIIGLIIDILQEEINKKMHIEFVWQSFIVVAGTCKFNVRIWEGYRSLDIIFYIIETESGRETRTNLDPNMLNAFNQRECTPLDILKLVTTRRYDELKFRQMPE